MVMQVLCLLYHLSSLLQNRLVSLATGNIQALGSLRMDKIFGKGVQQGGFLIPQNKIEQLMKYKHLLSAGQKNSFWIPCKQGVSWYLSKQWDC